MLVINNRDKIIETRTRLGKVYRRRERENGSTYGTVEMTKQEFEAVKKIIRLANEIYHTMWEEL
jgi:hypothetical protein